MAAASENTRVSRKPLHWKSHPANSSSWLSLGTGGCPKKKTVLPNLEGELHDCAFPSHARHRYCDS